MLLYCTFLGSIRVRVWSNLGMSWGSSCSLLCILQVQLIFSYHNAFSHSLFSINFLQLQKKETLAKEEFLLQVSQKIIFVCSLVSFKEGHSVSSTLKSDNALSPGLQNSYPDTAIKAFNLDIPLIHTQPHQEFLSNLRRVLGQHNLLLLELTAPLSSMSNAATYKSLPSVDKST